jgi:hypothetical protein
MPEPDRELPHAPYALLPSALLQHKPDGLTRHANDMNCPYGGSYVKRGGRVAQIDAKKAPGLKPGALAQTTGLKLTG